MTKSDEINLYIKDLEAVNETVTYFHSILSVKNNFRDMELTPLGRDFVFAAAKSVDFNASGNAWLIRRLSELTGVHLSTMIKEFKDACERKTHET